MAKKYTAPNLPAGFRNNPLLQLHFALQDVAPQLYAWMTDEDKFAELRLKVRDDGSAIAVLKGYDADGTPVVAFGTGYDGLSALMGANGAVTAGNWRVDKPWNPDADKGG